MTALQRSVKMSENAFVDNAKVMAKGQVTILKDVREVLGMTSGDRISFIVGGKSVRKDSIRSKEKGNSKLRVKGECYKL